MKSFLKFLVFVLLLALAISLIYVWQTRQSSVAQVQAQTKPEKFTPAEKTDLGSVDVLQRLDEEYTKVTAPISGRVGRLYITAGNQVTADETMLTTIVREDPMFVYFNVPEATALSRASAINIRTRSPRIASMSS